MMETVSEKADQLIKNYAFGSSVTGFIPIPAVDFISLLATQRVMLWRLSKLYGIPFSKNLARVFLTTLMSSSTSVIGSPLLGSMLKVIPGVGPVVSSSGMAALGGASTYAIGKIFQKHFEDGGNLKNFNPEAIKEDFALKLKEGETMKQQSC